MPRRRVAIILAMPLALAACGPRQAPYSWTKPGGSAAAFDMDHASCRVVASQRIPASYAPMQPVAPQTTVNVLTPRPAIPYATDPGPAPAADRNQGVREDAYRLCMMQRGYQVVRPR